MERCGSKSQSDAHRQGKVTSEPTRPVDTRKPVTLTYGQKCTPVLYGYSNGGYWASGTQTLSFNDSDEKFLVFIVLIGSRPGTRW